MKRSWMVLAGCALAVNVGCGSSTGSTGGGGTGTTSGTGGASSSSSSASGGNSGSTTSSSTSSTSSSSSSTSSTSSSSTSSTTSSSTSSSSTSSTTSSSSTTGPTCVAPAPLTGACAPGATCAGAASTCLGYVNQATSTTPGFRMSQLAFSKPAVFNAGIIAPLLGGAIMPKDNACHLGGSGTFSWLLRFDTAAGTLQTGGARPAASPAGPYTFDNETLGGTQVKPVTLTAPLSSTCTFDSSAGDVVLPWFLDPMGGSYVLIPLRGLRLHAGTLSPDHGCIGRFNAETLDPAGACLPDSAHPSFTPGATADGNINLEDADHILIASLQQSLCVLLSGNSSMYGTPSSSGTVCKRDATGKILYQGDWCSATNQAATTTCSDAVSFAATFAAQSVQIQ